MEERKGTYNENGEYVMTDEEAEKELKILNPLLVKFHEDVDGIFLMDEINEHIKKIAPYYKSKGLEFKTLHCPPFIRKQLEREAIIEKERQERDEAWLKMTKEERIEYRMQVARHATEFAKKLGMNVYELKDKGEDD